MRTPRLAYVSMSICLVAVVALALSGCGSTSTMSGDPAGATGTPPAVSAVAVQANGVAPNRAQEVQFTEAMAPATINAKSFQLTDASGKPVPGTVTYDPDFNTASFMPSPALQAGATYAGTITTAAASSGGVHLAKPYSFEFTTRATSDTSPLSVSSVSPAAGANCVSGAIAITITFNEAPEASTLTAGNLAVSGPGGAIAVKINTNITTAQVVLTPASPLPSGTISVTVSNVADLAGIKMTAPYTWSFSTACTSGGGGGGGGGTGGTSTQYLATLEGRSGNDVGQITVDTAGNFTVQLKGATANQALTVLFCPLVPANQTSPNCFSIGAVSTDANGDGSVTAKFPKSGSWAGDFGLTTSGSSYFETTYFTNYSPAYMSTLQPAKTVDGGILNSQDSNQAQAPLTSGTVTFSSSPAPNGSLQFTLNGAPPNTGFEFTEGLILSGSDGNYGLANSQGDSYFTTDSQGDLTVTFPPSGHGGDIFVVYPQNGALDPVSQQGYFGGFSVP